MKRVRRPIEDMIGESNQEAKSARGIQCPKCHCVQFGSGRGVRNTRPEDNGIRRYRVCRACQHVWVTHER